MPTGPYITAAPDISLDSSVYVALMLLCLALATTNEESLANRSDTIVAQSKVVSFGYLLAFMFCVLKKNTCLQFKL